MLDPRITDLARTQISLAFEESDQALTKDHMRIVGDCSKRGMLQSSIALRLVAERYENEIKVRGGQVLAILLRVIHHIGLSSVEDLKDDILVFLEPLLREESVKIWAKMKQMAPFKSAEQTGIGKMVNLEGPYKRAVESSLTKLKTEVELYSVKQARSMEKGRQGDPGSVSVVGDQNVIITGNLSNSQVSVTLDALTRDQISQALNKIAAALEDLQEGEPFSVGDLQEMVDDCRREVGKENPNQIRLQSLLLGIATTIQTSAALQPAYLSLRSAMACFGISLP